MEHSKENKPRRHKTRFNVLPQQPWHHKAEGTSGIGVMRRHVWFMGRQEVHSKSEMDFVSNYSFFISRYHYCWRTLKVSKKSKIRQKSPCGFGLGLKCELQWGFLQRQHLSPWDLRISTFLYKTKWKNCCRIRNIGHQVVLPCSVRGCRINRRPTTGLNWRS